MSLAARLKQARLEAGLTQKGLAEKSGVSQQNIQKIESGKNKKTSFILQLATATGVLPEWLQFGRGAKENKLKENNKNIEENQSIDLIRNKIEVKMARIAEYQIPILSWKDFDAFKMTLLTTLSIEQLLNSAMEKGRMLTVFLDEKKSNSKLGILEVENLDAMLSPTAHELSLYPRQKLIIDFNEKPQPEDLVFVQIKDTITVRQYILDGGKEILKALNPQYPIITDNFHIFGVIIQVIRNRNKIKEKTT